MKVLTYSLRPPDPRSKLPQRSPWVQRHGKSQWSYSLNTLKEGNTPREGGYVGFRFRVSGLGSEGVI